MSKKAIVVDLDGTLADVEHRVHHVRGTEKNWRSFNDKMIHDQLNSWCADLIRAMRGNLYEVILLTGRSEDYRKQTEDWLANNGVIYDALFMRAEADFREDCVIKREIYEQKIRDHYNILFVVEDRMSVVKMWRDLGLVCLQCDWGDF